MTAVEAMPYPEDMTSLEREILYYWRTCKEIKQAIAAADDADDIRLALEELEAIAMYTSSPSVREAAILFYTQHVGYPPF